MDCRVFGGLLTRIQIILDITALAVINVIGMCHIASQNVKILQVVRGVLVIKKDFGITKQKILANPIPVITGIATIFVSQLVVMIKNIEHKLHVITQVIL